MSSTADSLPKPLGDVPVEYGQPRVGPNLDQTYAPTYGLVHMMDFPGGHSVQYDSTPGKERVLVKHGSGTYTQITADGNRVEVTRGNQHDYHGQGYTMTVDQNGDVTMKGHHRVSFQGGIHMEVHGDLHQVVGGDYVQAVSGDMKQFVTGNIFQHSGKEMALSASKGWSAFTPKEAVLRGDSHLQFQTNGSADHDIKGNVNFNVDGNINHDGVKIDKTHKHQDVVAGADLSGPPEGA